MKMKKKSVWLWLFVVFMVIIGFNGFAFADKLYEFGANVRSTPTPTPKSTPTPKVAPTTLAPPRQPPPPSVAPAYVPTAWSQILPSSERFVLVMNNEAVLDKETGLVWERTPDTTIRTWFDAVHYAYLKLVGGRYGWRLPTVEEFASLIDPIQSNPSLPSGHPFINVQSDGYWSSTTGVGGTSTVSTTGAWVVPFGTNGVFDNEKSDSHYVWCVRGGHGYDAP